MDADTRPTAWALPRARYALDVGQALDLIESVIADRRHRECAEQRSCSIVSECLQLAGVAPDIADRMRRRRIRELYASHELPLRLTPGAVVALDIAQRSELLGFPDDVVLAKAVEVTSHLPLLVSDRVWRSAHANLHEHVPDVRSRNSRFPRSEVISHGTV